MRNELVEIEFTEDFATTKKGTKKKFSKGFARHLVEVRKVAKFPVAKKKAAPKKESK